jgi:hypothetical protein
MDKGSISGRGKRFSLQRPDRLGPTHPPIHWEQEAPSLEVKRLGLEADDSPPSVPKLRMRVTVPLLPHTSIWCGA